MTAATKEQALEKLDAIANKIGYPDTLARLRHARDRAAATPWATSQRATPSSTRRDLAKIGKPVDQHGVAHDARRR